LDCIGDDSDYNGEHGRNQECLGAFDRHFKALDSVKMILDKFRGFFSSLKEQEFREAKK